MKENRLVLKGKTVFILALVATVLTVVTVYLTGINYNRSIASNLYISLGLISTSLFLFLTYALYKGTKLVNNYPKFKNYAPGTIMHNVSLPGFSIDIGEGIGGMILSILLWIAMTIAIIVLLFLFEALFWLSLFIIFASLYWVFSRALRVVFYKARRTNGDLPASMVNALTYTILYTVWLFGIAVTIDLIK